MKYLFVFPILFIFISARSQVSIDFPYADSPRIFAPGIISDGFANRDLALSPDGNDLMFTLQWYFGMYSVIFHTHKIAGGWSKPDTAWFSGKYNDLEPAFSPDGNKIFFTSNRPLNASGFMKNDYDIWYVQKKGNGWTDPINIGVPINSEKDEFYPSLTKKGDLYFTRNNDDARDDIFVSHFTDGQYQKPEALPETVNSNSDDFNAFIDPDEQFIIFSSYKRADDLGKGDLYYSLKKNDVWLPAKHFGNGINSTTLDYSPFVSTDHRFFFLTSKRTMWSVPFPKAKSADEIKSALYGYGNGFEDIYIMDFKAVQKVMN